MELSVSLGNLTAALFARLYFLQYDWDCRNDLLVDFEIVAWFFPSFLSELIELSDFQEFLEVMFFGFDVDHEFSLKCWWFIEIYFETGYHNRYHTFPTEVLQ